MIKNAHILEQLERNIAAKRHMSFKNALKIFEAMWQEAITLKRLPPKNSLEGIERVIRMAKIINSCSKNSLRF